MNIIIPKGHCKYNQSHVLDEEMLANRRGTVLTHNGKEYKVLFPKDTMVCTTCLEQLFYKFIKEFIA